MTATATVTSGYAACYTPGFSFPASSDDCYQNPHSSYHCDHNKTCCWCGRSTRPPHGPYAGANIWPQSPTITWTNATPRNVPWGIYGNSVEANTPSAFIGYSKPVEDAPDASLN